MVCSLATEITFCITNIKASDNEADLQLVVDLEKIIQIEDADFKNADILRRIQEIFKRRLSRVLDTPLDYTFVSGGINSHWINLAYYFGRLSGLPYLVFLFPQVHNQKDLKSLSAAQTDPTQFILMEDGNGLQLVLMDSLRESLNSKGLGSTERALSLRELRRFKVKAHDFTVETGPFRLALTNGSKLGLFPRSTLPAFMKVLQCYFERYAANPSTDQQLNEAISELIYELNASFYEDVYKLYGYTFMVGATEKHVYEFLIRLLGGHLEEIKVEMASFAVFLSGYIDPSCIVDSAILVPAYQRLGVGPGFGPSQLHSCLDQLKLGASTTITRALTALQTRLQQESTISEQSVVALHKIYQIRWDEMIANNFVDNYTRKQDGINQFWIHTAQLAKGAGLFKFLKSVNAPDRPLVSVYEFLMYTLNTDWNFITEASIDDLPLSYCLLDATGTKLISLVDSARRWNSTLTFYNCSGKDPVRFQEKEAEALQYAHRRFQYQHYIDAIGGRYNDSPISKNTVAIFRGLVNESLFEEGLRPETPSSSSLSTDQLRCIQIAWLHFYSEMRKLEINSPEEHARALEQRITMTGFTRSVKEILGTIRDIENQDACLSNAARYFAQLVADYDSVNLFASRLEFPLANIQKRLDMQYMRTHSAGKVYSEYSLEEAEAIRRCNILMVSLLTYPFEGSTPMRFWDMSNNGNPITSKMFDVLKPFFEGKENFACHIYANVMEFVKTQTDVNDPMKEWLASLRNETLFFNLPAQIGPKSFKYVDYKILFCRLSSLCDNVYVREFLDGLVSLAAQNRSEGMKQVKANVSFSKFANTVPDECYNRVKSATTRLKMIPTHQFYQQVYDYVVWSIVTPKVSLVGIIGNLINASRPPRFHSSFFTENRPKDWSAIMSLQHLLTHIQMIIAKQAKNVPGGFENQYVKGLLATIPDKDKSARYSPRPSGL